MKLEIGEFTIHENAADVARQAFIAGFPEHAPKAMYKLRKLRKLHAGTDLQSELAQWAADHHLVDDDGRPAPWIMLEAKTGFEGVALLFMSGMKGAADSLLSMLSGKEQQRIELVYNDDWDKMKEALRREWRRIKDLRGTEPVLRTAERHARWTILYQVVGMTFTEIKQYELEKRREKAPQDIKTFTHEELKALRLDDTTIPHAVTNFLKTIGLAKRQPDL